MQPPVQHQPATKPGSHGHDHAVVFTATSSEPLLSPRRGVRVVLNDQITADSSGNIFPHPLSPPYDRGKAHDRPSLISDPRSSNPDPGDGDIPLEPASG